jgi:hypothetical protein
MCSRAPGQEDNQSRCRDEADKKPLHESKLSQHRQQILVVIYVPVPAIGDRRVLLLVQCPAHREDSDLGDDQSNTKEQPNDGLLP